MNPTTVGIFFYPLSQMISLPTPHNMKPSKRRHEKMVLSARDVFNGRLDADFTFFNSPLFVRPRREKEERHCNKRCFNLEGG